jgi:tetratricopeptide (TPR) repeat protein
VQILSVLSKFKPGEVEAPTENDALAEPPEFLVLKKFLYKYKVPTKPKTSLVSLFVLLFLLLVSTVVYYYAIWHPKQVQIDEHLALARDFLNVEAFQFAKSEFRQVMDLDKNHSEARKSLEKIGIYEAIQESDTDSAVLEQKIKALLAENPNDFHSRVLMAELYIGTDPEKAMENLQVAVEINPKAPGALFRMGILYQQQQNIPQAIEMMKKAIEVSNQSPLYRLNLGALYLKTGDEIKAEETYLALLKNDPTYLQTYFRISDLWMMRGNLNKALEFQQELAKHLENRRTCILPKNQGKWFFEIVSNQQSEIIELYDIPEKKFYAWYGMALTMYLLDRKDEATRYAEKADSLSLVGLDESIKALVLSDMSRYVQKNPSLQARSQGFEKDLLVRENMP